MQAVFRHSIKQNPSPPCLASPPGVVLVRTAELQALLLPLFTDPVQEVEEKLKDDERKQPGFVLSSFQTPSLYGYMGDMNYCSMEEKCGGMLRCVTTGARKVVVTRLAAFVGAVRRCEPLQAHAKSLSAVRRLFKSLSADSISRLASAAPSGDPVVFYWFAQPAGTLSYVPPGYLMAECTENGQLCCGLRYATLLKRPGEAGAGAEAAKGVQKDLQAYLDLLVNSNLPAEQSHDTIPVVKAMLARLG